MVGCDHAVPTFNATALLPIYPENCFIPLIDSLDTLFFGCVLPNLRTQSYRGWKGFDLVPRSPTAKGKGDLTFQRKTVTSGYQIGKDLERGRREGRLALVERKATTATTLFALLK